LGTAVTLLAGLAGSLGSELTTALADPAISAAPASPAEPAAPGNPISPLRVVSPQFSYDLVTAVGGVLNFGGAGWYGNERWRHLSAPIVGMALTPDGRGYWLAGANGSVFNLGDAGWYGSLARDQLQPNQSIVAIASSPDGKGYWLVDASGAVIAFGDAPPIDAGQSLPAADLATPIVAGAIAPGGHGAWLTDSAGHVYNIGGAPWFGSLANHHLVHPVTTMAAIPSGRGYWLANSAGDVWDYGGATGGVPGPPNLEGSVVGMIPAENRYGYWAVTGAGTILSGGDATTRGDTTAAVTQSTVVGIVAAPQLDPVAPTGSIGYDINWPQCAYSGSTAAGTLPGPPAYAYDSFPFTVGIIGVDGWAANDYNTCLAAEVSWAKRATYPKGSGQTGTPPYDLYMFLNSPSPASTIDQTGPAGTCSTMGPSALERCLAYNYGYNSARKAVSYATSKGAKSSVWWLDIENDICAPGMWNDAGNGEWWSCDLSLNSQTIQGALDALRAMDITAGIYCTAVQWAGITNGYVPTGGSPLIWIAGARWTSPPFPVSYGFIAPSNDTKFCTQSQYAFAKGKPTLLQQTPGGSNNYPFDPDLAC
jgi:hypothetical protein